MTIILRDYQESLVNAIRAKFASSIRRVLAVAPTGSGKTVIFSHMAARAIARNKRVWIMVHREELIDQVASTLDAFGVRYGFIAAGEFYDPHNQINICSVQTLARRLDRLQKPDLLICDEAHHSTGKTTWGKIIAACSDSFVLGVTATPCRLSGEGLKESFDAMVEGPTCADLIASGALCDYQIFAPEGPDVSTVGHQGGDFKQSDLSERMDKLSITGDAVQHYLKHARGKRAIARAVSIQHSLHITEQFNAAGIPCEHVDGATPKDQRKDAIRKFVSGETLILTNVGLFSEGFDVPAVEVAIDLRPTESLSLWLQFCGRALRPFEGKKKALILDHAGNAWRHGLPDEGREWSLEGVKKSKKTNAEPVVKIKTCNKCFAAIPAHATTCRYCAHVFEVAPRAIEEKEGELVETDKEAMIRERKKAQGQASSYEDLVSLGIRRGMKNPHGWAAHVLKARKMKYAEA